MIENDYSAYLIQAQETLTNIATLARARKFWDAADKARELAFIAASVAMALTRDALKGK